MPLEEKKKAPAYAVAVCSSEQHLQGPEQRWLHG